MSLDRSLKSKGSMTTSRSVWTRAERLSKLMAEKKFDPAKDTKALGLAKMRIPKK